MIVAIWNLGINTYIIFQNSRREKGRETAVAHFVPYATGSAITGRINEKREWKRPQPKRNRITFRFVQKEERWRVFFNFDFKTSVYRKRQHWFRACSLQSFHCRFARDSQLYGTFNVYNENKNAITNLQCIASVVDPSVGFFRSASRIPRFFFIRSRKWNLQLRRLTRILKWTRRWHEKYTGSIT